MSKVRLTEKTQLTSAHLPLFSIAFKKFRRNLLNILFNLVKVCSTFPLKIHPLLNINSLEEGRRILQCWIGSPSATF